MKKFIALALMIIGVSSPAYSGYDQNIVGKIVSVLTYPDGRLMIKLENQPQKENGTYSGNCDAAFFSVEATQPGIGRMFARAMLAYANQAPITIGYDSVGDCAWGFIRIHRVG